MFRIASLVTPARLALTFVAVAAVSALASTPSGAAGAGNAPAQGAGSPGKAVYDRHCAECHGRTGQGDGPAAIFLNPRPRDFSTGQYKIRTTEDGSLPSDEDLARSVREGLPGSAMPGWKGLLSEAQITGVIDYVKSLSPRFANEPVKAVSLGSPVASTPRSVARGLEVFDNLGCAGCHGTDGRGKDAVQSEFEDDWSQPPPSRGPDRALDVPGRAHGA